MPGAYLAKHLQALTRAGVFEAVPGRGGGYRLARPAMDITVLEVVDAVEGRTRAFQCKEIRQNGPAGGGPPSDYRNVCGIAKVMYDAEAAYRESLAQRDDQRPARVVSPHAEPAGPSACGANGCKRS